MTFYAPTHFVFTHVAPSPWFMDIQPSGTGRTQWKNANTSSSTRSTTSTTESITTTQTAKSLISSIDAVSAITSSASDISGTLELDATTEGTTLAMSIHPLASGTTDASGYVRLDIQPSGAGRSIEDSQCEYAQKISSHAAMTSAVEAATAFKQAMTCSTPAIGAASPTATNTTSTVDASPTSLITGMSIQTTSDDASGYVRLDSDAGWLLASFGDGQIDTTGTLLPMPFAAGEYQVTVHVEAGSVVVMLPEPCLLLALLVAMVRRGRQ